VILHLGEVGLAWGAVPVAAYPSEVGVPPEALHEVLDVGDLLQLAEHESPEVPFGVVDYGPPRAVSVEAGP